MENRARKNFGGSLIVMDPIKNSSNGFRDKADDREDGVSSDLSTGRCRESELWKNCAESFAPRAKGILLGVGHAPFLAHVPLEISLG